MSDEDRERLPAKDEEQDTLLTKVVSLAPLIAVILQILEMILKLFGVIQ
jgi:hypothetical protein